MNLRIQKAEHYIAAVLEQQGETAVLRRWPWPDNARGRERHLNEAMEYTEKVGKVLCCPVEIV